MLIRTNSFRPIILLFAAVLLGSLVGCQPSSEASKKELFDTFAALDEAVRVGDLDAFVSHYADPAFHLPPGHSRNSTRDEIKDFLDGILDLYELQGEPVIIFSDDASMAFVYGVYAIRANESKGIEPIGGRFVLVWKRSDEGWQCLVDIWNTDDPRFGHL